MTVLTAKGPVLVHMFDFSQLNSVRTLPYLAEWQRRYGEFGLRTVGIQVPRFPFGTDPDTVAAGLARLDIDFPVVIDEKKILQESYGFEGWPSLFLWSRGGLLRWFHFGEGEYEGTERAIRSALVAAGKATPGPGDEPADRQVDSAPELPPMMDLLRPIDATGVEVIPPGEELLPGDGEPFTAADGDGFDLEYENHGYASVHITASGNGRLLPSLNGESLAPVEIDGGGLYTLVDRPTDGPHRLAVDLEGEPEIWSISFSPRLAD